MGSITRSFANNITTSGVLLPASLTNNSIANVTAYNASVATGGMKLISTQTASNSASISFTTGIDSTYKEYQFWFIDIHPRTDTVRFQFNLSTDSGSNYNVTKTTTIFNTYHYENDSLNDFYYSTTQDLAQSTAFQNLNVDQVGNGADESLAGSLQLFNPASTTYVKHFIGTTNFTNDDGVPAYGSYTSNSYTAGYGNTTSAVNAVRFQMSSGNFDGTILLYGIV
jgi:hypothetical protein